MKKWLCLLLAMLMLCSVGCGKKAASDKDDAPATTAKGALTKDDAIAAAEAYWQVTGGEVDPATGNRVSVVVTSFPGEDDPYFRVALRHIIEGEGSDNGQQEEIVDTRITQIDVVLVHSATGEIKKP